MEKDDLSTHVSRSGASQLFELELELAQDWALQAHQVAEAHLNEVWEWYHADEDGESDLGPDPAFAPFCGCETCEVREILLAALPYITAGVLRDNGIEGMSRS